MRSIKREKYDGCSAETESDLPFIQRPVFLRSSVAEITRLVIGGEWVSRNPIGGVLKATCLLSVYVAGGLSLMLTGINLSLSPAVFDILVSETQIINSYWQWVSMPETLLMSSNWQLGIRHGHCLGIDVRNTSYSSPKRRDSPQVTCMNCKVLWRYYQQYVVIELAAQSVKASVVRNVTPNVLSEPFT